MIRSRYTRKQREATLSISESPDEKLSKRRRTPRRQRVVRLVVPAAALLLFFLLRNRRALPWIEVGNLRHKNTEDGLYISVKKSSLKKFTPVPEKARKTFAADKSNAIRPMVRAFRSRGFVQIDDYRKAQFVLTYSFHHFNGVELKEMKPWQRHNLVTGFGTWNNKEKMVNGFKAYEAKVGREMFFLPQTFRLNLQDDMEAFQQRLENGGKDLPWVLKRPGLDRGLGIEMLGPNSKELLNVPARVEKAFKSKKTRYIIQQYVCNELTWNGHKYDVRMYFYVASLDPLVVLYHDGYVRVGNAVYNENDFNNTRGHLTTHTFLGAEDKGSFDQFRHHVEEHQRSSSHLSHIYDPIQHVKNQFKESLAEFVAAFKDNSFKVERQETEDSFAFYCADFILDSDLDVWLIEPQAGCGIREKYDFFVEMHDELFGPMVDIVEEVWRKQENGLPVLPLENVGSWEVVYADGWKFSFDGYERSKNKRGCNNAKGSAY